MSLTSTPAAPVSTDEAYNQIDRFLRNNLDDDAYASHSAALDVVLFAAAPVAPAVPTAWVPLMDTQWMNIVNARIVLDADRAEDAVAEAVKLTEAKLKQLNSHSSPAVPEGWQPIETAPKDAKSVLLVVGGVVEIGFFAGVTGWIIERHIYKGLPTHWMPLPAAPIAAMQATGATP